MRKIAIFVEGKTELIFAREILPKIFGHEAVSFICLRLRQESWTDEEYRYKSSNAKLHFLIVDVGGDERVLSVIKERETEMIEKRKFNKIIGLRDMYSEEYKKLSDKIDLRAIKKIIKAANNEVASMTNHQKIQLHFAIMEIEAWFLAFYKIFARLDKKLTVEFIERKLGVNLEQIDPQTYFLKPSNQVKTISNHSSKFIYKKGKIENIMSIIQVSDFENVQKNKKVSAFVDFYKELQKLK